MTIWNSFKNTFLGYSILDISCTNHHTPNLHFTSNKLNLLIKLQKNFHYIKYVNYVILKCINKNSSNHFFRDCTYLSSHVLKYLLTLLKYVKCEIKHSHCLRISLGNSQKENKKNQSIFSCIILTLPENKYFPFINIFFCFLSKY